MISPAQTIQAKRPPAVKEIHVLWITAGLGCDGDSVSITAATQPSVEDVVLGAIPGLPKVHLHNPVLAYEVGDDFMKHWYAAERRPARSLRAGRRRIDSQRKDQEGRLLGRAGHQSRHRPADHDLRMDRSAGPQGPGGDDCRHVRRLRRHPCHGRKPDRLHGVGRLSGLELEIEGRAADHQRSRLPGPARQLHGNAAVSAVSGGGPGPDDSAG